MKIKRVLTNLLIFQLILFSSRAIAVEIIAPEAGNDVAIAKHYIFTLAEQPCGKVTSAKRDSKGFVIANCSNGEKYLIAILKDAPMTNGTRANVPVAMKCSLAQSMLKISCPN